MSFILLKIGKYFLLLFSYNSFVFLTSILKGVKIEFYSGDFNPSEILKLINQEKITAFCGTPTLLNMMSKFKRNEANTLKHICISGECMGEAIAKRISDTFKDANIYHVYGLTEASPRVAYLPPHMFSKYSDCVGIALKSVFFKVLNDAGEEVSKNSVGKLWVKGKNVMLGYYNDPVKTNEVIKNGWLNTGDLALINEKGLLKIMGRSDDLIIKAGMNIYPREVEDVLKKDGRVKEVVLSSERNEKLGVQLKLTVAGDFNNEKEIKQLCISSLPAYQIPSKIILVQEILKNGSGKIIRR